MTTEFKRAGSSEQYNPRESCERGPTVSSARVWVALAALTLTLLTLGAWSPSDADSSAPDPRAILQSAVDAMGGTAPLTSDTTGTVTIQEGGSTRTGTIEVLTKTLQESNDTIDAERHEEHIYNNQSAADVLGTQKTRLPKELMLSTQTMLFPLVLFQSMLSNSDLTYAYVGQEVVDGVMCDRITITNSFSSQPDLADLASMSVKDIWIGQTSKYPIKIATLRCFGRGAIYQVPLEVHYSDFRDVGGPRVPYHIEESLNGSSWRTISFSGVTLNGAISDDRFGLE